MKGATVPNASSGRLPEVDGLRAIAILLVLCRHIFCSLPIGWLRWLSDMGWVGVDLFFVLSGFLIGGILLDQRGATNYYRVFYLRRFFRIVPLYALLVLPGLLVLSFGLQSYFGGHSLTHRSAWNIWPCLFFLQDFCCLFQPNLPYLAPTWSVAVEEQFYILLPLLVRHLDSKRLLRILVPAILCAPLLRSLLFYFMGEKAVWGCYEMLPCRWDALLLGMGGAVIYRKPEYCAWLAERLGQLRVLWCLSALASIAFLSGADGPYNARMGCLGFTLIDLFFACSLLLAVMNPSGTLNAFLSRPFFKPIAAISYGVYLLHIPITAITESALRAVHIEFAQVSWTKTGVGVFALLVTFLLAALSWKFFESPLIRRGHRYQFQQPAQRSGEVAAPSRCLS